MADFAEGRDASAKATKEVLMVGSIICGVDGSASARGAAEMPGSKTRDPNDDDLMRWEWEGGAPDTVSDRARAGAAAITAIRSPPAGRDARQEVDPTEPGAESGAADV